MTTEKQNYKFDYVPLKNILSYTKIMYFLLVSSASINRGDKYILVLCLKNLMVYLYLERINTFVKNKYNNTLNNNKCIIIIYYIS